MLDQRSAIILLLTLNRSSFDASLCFFSCFSASRLYNCCLVLVTTTSIRSVAICFRCSFSACTRSYSSSFCLNFSCFLISPASFVSLAANWYSSTIFYLSFSSLRSSFFFDSSFSAFDNFCYSIKAPCLAKN